MIQTIRASPTAKTSRRVAPHFRIERIRGIFMEDLRFML
jgi:hypothetical protein